MKRKLSRLDTLYGPVIPSEAGTSGPCGGMDASGLTPGSPEWRQNVAHVMAGEVGQPAKWFYLSYAKDKKDGGFQGAVIVQAVGFTFAILRVKELEIEIHGQVVGLELTEDQIFKVPQEMRNRRLTSEELEALNAQ